MNFLSRLICRRILRSGSVCALVVASVTWACGPDFPNSYYDLPTEAVLAAPEGFFAAEIARLAAAIEVEHRAVRVPEGHALAATKEAELADLRRALAERGVGGRQANELEWDYQRCREWLEAQRSDGVSEDPPNVPVGIPLEFSLYFAGAVAWQRGALDDARARWETVLALPTHQRRYRSTWAAFMLGRAHLRASEGGADAGREAALAFRQVRALAKSGFPDPLGLAAASLGWEARVALNAEDYPEAVRLYLEHYATGDDTAVASLRSVVNRMIQSGVDRKALAADPGCRRVLTAYFVSRARAFADWAEDSMAPLVEAWAQALHDAGVQEVAEADRLAWLAYDLGWFEIAEQWLELAPEQSAEARWIGAKLALQRGDLPVGEARLRAALASDRLGEAHRGRVAAELGRVCLAQDDYAGALTAWLAGQHWEDVAYVAERVMTTAELTRFVDHHCAPAAAPVAASNGWFAAEPQAMLRHLLARRLARAGEVEQAQAYFPEDVRSVFTNYLTDVRAGFDLDRPVAERAASFWRAAQLVRERGLELLGTELDPDWAIWGGYFAMPASADRRRGERETADVLAPTSEEAARLEAVKVPSKRFHYRYRAAELAWWAASLMPNETAETATILHTAGGWLKHRDPEAAKPFYQALVIRCGHTELGREAAQRRWFPDEQ